MNKSTTKHGSRSLKDIFFTFLLVGFTAFGGPAAHVGYFREIFVSQRQWLTDRNFSELLGLCQFLPGPGSTQLAVAIGTLCRGPVGGIAALVGFSLPASLLMIGFGLGFLKYDIIGDFNWIQGLKIAVAAVVLRAVVQMAPSLCPDFRARTIAFMVFLSLLLISVSSGNIIAIAVAAVIGLVWRRPLPYSEDVSSFVVMSRSFAIGNLFFLTVLFVLLPIVALVPTVPTIVGVFDSLFRSGSLVFGGGHVVLPLLESEFVPTNWLDQDVFFAGYGIMQALPGPMFAFAGYLGTVMAPVPNGVIGGVICLIGLFLPGLLLIWGLLPFWNQFKNNQMVSSMFADVNAAVVGILASALYHPIWSNAIHDWIDGVLALSAFFAIQSQRIPTWVVVIGCVAGSTVLSQM